MVEKGIAEAGDIVRSLTGNAGFDLAVVLGSGLGALADQIETAVSVPFPNLPSFPPATVPGHAGSLVAGVLEGLRVLLFKGRYHIYEGYDARQVTTSIRLAHFLGCGRLLLTNAVGGINAEYRAGDFMYIADHINLLGDNPLRGETENPFIDLSCLYDQSLFPSLLEYALNRGIGLHQGVLAALPGPSYETPAEIRMLQRLGADAVSMSTVPEAIMGKYLGMEVVGLSFVSNAAAGLAAAPLSHVEVLEAGRRGSEHFSSLVRRLMLEWQEKSNREIAPNSYPL